MLQVPNKRLPPTSAAKLKQYQLAVDQAASYALQVDEAKRLFRQYNTTANATFTDVKSQLSAMCRGARRCMYCEDSVADEVEHLKPKDLYPEVVFSWTNYCYACGPCNGPKNNKYSVLNRSSQVIDVTRGRGAPVVPPTAGTSALLDPRREDPLKFIMLDLTNTFEFTPIPAPGTKEFLRAEYTIQLLRLNDRDYLIKARRNAYSGYRARLAEYIQRRDAGASVAALKLLREGIQQSPHPMVWAEMVRQHPHHADISPLFAAAPEALTF